MNYNHVTSSSTNNNSTNNININSYTNRNNKKIQMTEPWSIPRPTLSSSASSSNSSQKTNSTPASLNRKQPKHRTSSHGRGQRNLGYQHEGTFSSNSSYEIENSRHQRTNSKLDELKQRFDDYTNTTKQINSTTHPNPNNSSNINNNLNYKINGKYATNINEQDELTPTPKRGSRSSQGSSDSNNSSHSASSGSLLLTVANLENFAKIHQKTSPDSIDKLKAYSIYSTNITLSTPEITNVDSGVPTTNHHHHHHHRPNSESHTVISMDKKMMLHQKTKDLDALSIASSTHFTVVNGMGGPQRVPKSGFCSRGHQITILIVTMSILFLIGISAAVFMLEMRARDMPK